MTCTWAGIYVRFVHCAHLCQAHWKLINIYKESHLMNIITNALKSRGKGMKLISKIIYEK